MNAQAPVTVTPPAPGTATVVTSDGTVIARTEPVVALRTSTKSVVGGGTGVLLVQLLQSVDWPGEWFDMFLMNGIVVAGVPLLVAWLTARYTKSPIEPGLL